MVMVILISWISKFQVPAKKGTSGITYTKIFVKYQPIFVKYQPILEDTDTKNSKIQGDLRLFYRDQTMCLA